jgi:hypothetical protein
MLKGPTALTVRPVTGLGYIEPVKANGFRPQMAALAAQKVQREGTFKPQLAPIPAAAWGTY